MRVQSQVPFDRSYLGIYQYLQFNGFQWREFLNKWAG